MASLYERKKLHFRIWTVSLWVIIYDLEFYRGKLKDHGRCQSTQGRNSFSLEKRYYYLKQKWSKSGCQPTQRRKCHVVVYTAKSGIRFSCSISAIFRWFRFYKVLWYCSKITLFFLIKVTKILKLSSFPIFLKFFIYGLAELFVYCIVSLIIY